MFCSLIRKIYLVRPFSIYNVTFVFGYYNQFTFLLQKINFQLVFKDHSVNHFIYHIFYQNLIIMTLNVLLSFRFHYDYTETVHYKIKINCNDVYVVKRETRKKYFVHFKKRICITVTSHVNISESNNTNTYNSDNVIGN